MKDKIEKQVIADVKQVLAEIDIESQIAYYTDKKRIKEAVKRGLEDIIHREMAGQLMLSIKKTIYKKMGEVNPIIEQRVMEIIAQEFKL